MVVAGLKGFGTLGWSTDLCGSAAVAGSSDTSVGFGLCRQLAGRTPPRIALRRSASGCGVPGAWLRRSRESDQGNEARIVFQFPAGLEFMTMAPSPSVVEPGWRKR